MNQASFFCPNCNQLRLFQSTPMNHTPHILAAVFLCGLWLPIWALIAMTHQDVWRCAFCGYTNALKYLANPLLAEHELAASQQRQIVAAQHQVFEARGEEERREQLASMPRNTLNEKLRYFWAAYPAQIVGLGLITLIFGLAIVGTLIPNPSRTTEAPKPTVNSNLNTTVTTVSTPQTRYVPNRRHNGVRHAILQFRL